MPPVAGRRISPARPFPRNSERQDRIFPAVLAVAKEVVLLGRKRVLESTALYYAVATQDTVTLIRSSIRALLRVAPTQLASELGAVLERDDDYATPAGSPCRATIHREGSSLTRPPAARVAGRRGS